MIEVYGFRSPRLFVCLFVCTFLSTLTLPVTFDLYWLRFVYLVGIFPSVHHFQITLCWPFFRHWLYYMGWPRRDMTFHEKEKKRRRNILLPMFSFYLFFLLILWPFYKSYKKLLPVLHANMCSPFRFSPWKCTFSFMFCVAVWTNVFVCVYT